MTTTQSLPRRYPKVEELVLDQLPHCAVTKVDLIITHDGFGREICLPVLVAKGGRDGPVFGITAAVHGDEINGIPVIHNLFDGLNLKKMRGVIVAVPIVNQPGFLAATRTFNDGVDLNNIFPGDPAGNESQVYAARFCEKLVTQFDYLCDLHTASFGRVNSLYVRADLDESEITAAMARLQHPQIILHNSASDGTLRGYAEELGIPSITIEIGNPHRFHPDYIRRTLAGLRAILGEIKMISKRQRAPGPTPILCERSYWLYTDHGGLLEVFPNVTEMVAKGQLVARLTNVYGDVIKEYKAPEAGVVIGKSVHPVGQSGSRILHLGIVKPQD